MLVRSVEQRELLGRGGTASRSDDDLMTHVTCVGAMLSKSNAQRVLDAPVTAVFCADLEPARSIPRLEEEGRLAGRDAKGLEDLTLAVGYYATHGHVASALKGIAAHYLSPLRPVPQPVRAEAWALKSAMMAAQNYMLAASAHGLATAPMEGFAQSRVREDAERDR